MKNYCISSRLLILHGNKPDRSDAHSHTLVVSAFLQYSAGSLEGFSTMEDRLNACLARYEGQYLNDMPEFREDSSSERITECLFWDLSSQLEADGIRLTRLEVKETPLRTCAMGWEESPAS